MDIERRQCLRFFTPLKLELEKESNEVMPGQIRNFSRGGLRACFDSFDFAPATCVNLKIQRPNKDDFSLASAEVVWKKAIEGKWEVGMKLKEFSNWVKTEILELGFKEWCKSHKLPV
ncbi:PilZ domain-containing protein [Candidatus Omnitrophota bacterium]